MSARILGASSLSRRFVLLFECRHRIGERFISHGRFKEIPYTPFAPKFKPRPRIVPLFSFQDTDTSVVYHEGPGRVTFIFTVILLFWFIQEIHKYKEDQIRINRQKIKYKRLGISPYPYLEKTES